MFSMQEMAVSIAILLWLSCIASYPDAIPFRARPLSRKASSIYRMARDATLRSRRRTRLGSLQPSSLSRPLIWARPTTLHGPIELDQPGIATAVSEVLGRMITYQPLTIPQYLKRLERLDCRSL
jgi:hypothetical protein